MSKHTEYYIIILFKLPHISEDINFLLMSRDNHNFNTALTTSLNGLDKGFLYLFSIVDTVFLLIFSEMLYHIAIIHIKYTIFKLGQIPNVK